MDKNERAPATPNLRRSARKRRACQYFSGEGQGIVSTKTPEGDSRKKADVATADKVSPTLQSINGYYEVEKILDRRVVRWSGDESVVQYLVKWKGDYDNEWLLAEQLDQNSLAAAFRQFPTNSTSFRASSASEGSREKRLGASDLKELNENNDVINITAKRRRDGQKEERGRGDFDSVLWPQLVQLGWTMETKRHKDRYYFPPGVTRANGALRKDFFDSKKQVVKHVNASSLPQPSSLKPSDPTGLPLPVQPSTAREKYTACGDSAASVSISNENKSTASIPEQNTNNNKGKGPGPWREDRTTQAQSNADNADMRKGISETNGGPTHKLDDTNGSKSTAKAARRRSASIDSDFKTAPDEVDVMDECDWDGDLLEDYDLDSSGDEGAPISDPARGDNVQNLAESNYDAPGTVELCINRRVFRVGDSYFAKIDGQRPESIVLTISLIIPKRRLVVCRQFMRVVDTFLGKSTPKHLMGQYIQLKNSLTVPISSLRKLCKKIDKCSWFYDSDVKRKHCFCFYVPNGKITSRFPKLRPTVLELFGGAGGMSLGFKNAGFNVKWVVEKNECAAATWKANQSQQDAVVFTDDARDFLRLARLNNPAYPAVGDVDHIHASPPCKGFSRANRYGGAHDDKNNSLAFVFVDAVAHFCPTTATFENVPGLLLEEYRNYLQEIIVALFELKYQVRLAVLTASAYGDPQNRRRVFLWAARSGCVLPDTPPRTHGEGLMPVMNVKDAIGCLEEHKPVTSGSGAISCKGIIMHNHVCSGSDPSSDDHVLTADRPARTVLASSRPAVHYNGHRFLTAREVACLQSFPSDYQFFGGIGEQHRQIGNSVPVKLATSVAQTVAAVHGLP